MKRKSIVVSALALMISVGLMVFGVYAAGVASLSVTGEVEYKVHDVAVLVQGKVSDVLDENGAAVGVSAYKLAVVPDEISDELSAEKVSSGSQYLGYTVGASLSNDMSDNLDSWNIGDLRFVEDNGGIRDVVVSLQFVNFSRYPITATIEFSADESSFANVTRTVVGLTVYGTVDLAQAGKSNATKEIVITYHATSDSQNVSANIGMNVTFAKYAQPVTFESEDFEAIIVGNSAQIVAYNGTGINSRVVEVPQTLTYEGMDYTVTAILDNAFENFTKLRAAYIPSTVMTVSASAFNGCSALGLVGTDATDTNFLSKFASDTVSVMGSKSITEFQNSVIDNFMVKIIYKHDRKSSLSYGCCSLQVNNLYPSGYLYSTEEMPSSEDFYVFEYMTWAEIVEEFEVDDPLSQAIDIGHLDFADKGYWSLSSNNPTFTTDITIIFYHNHKGPWPS